MNKKLTFLLIPSLALTACSSTGVIPMSQDSYFIGKKDGAPGLGASLSNKAEVYQEANSFCGSKGLEVKTLRETVTPARLARLGSTELHFKCVKTGGTAKSVLNENDTVIQIRLPEEN